MIADWLLKLTNENKTWAFSFASCTYVMSKATHGTTNVFIEFIRSLSLTYELNQTNAFSE
ncbi:hypothetical protein TOL5_01290 [Acinetobacter sp. Tol 5]|nr:hypothetical protein TOL5_01290 [Acinetobacter sp. Tol 5]